MGGAEGEKSRLVLLAVNRGRTFDSLEHDVFLSAKALKGALKFLLFNTLATSHPQGEQARDKLQRL